MKEKHKRGGKEKRYRNLQEVKEVGLEEGKSRG